ncbi:SRPBCC family protein [Aerosakkonema funiforme]|uniref:Cyclase n=1 Tax=Aerosakkonema funiforme FACHB-1375 TaxID=2949571 RepID=A0A926VE67_9CYAN|nr:SRPBCC family protein [Aerosakkonema funiforme]MBD2182119.1 cyclase [Aerosakkonema funiforme FACHB-1375]
MTVPSVSDSIAPAKDVVWDKKQQIALLSGEILLETRSHSAWGGACTASMYLPCKRSQAWQQLTDYPRWVQYFPDLIRSEVLHRGDNLTGKSKRLYQIARKAFLMFTAEVEIYLKVIEVVQQQIQFRMEKGSFIDFAADLKLQDCSNGTILTYSVQATPNIPVPSIFIQQAMHLDLPANMRKMRQVLCS